MTEGFPLPINKLALNDIDGTLINQDYLVTDSRINEYISHVQSAGWVLGLSSDTPLEAMETWKSRFGLNGPLVAEKGAMVKDATLSIVDDVSLNHFSEAKILIEDYLLNQQHILWKGNPVEAIRDNIQIGSPGEIVVLLNTLRQCSLSIFV